MARSGCVKIRLAEAGSGQPHLIKQIPDPFHVRRGTALDVIPQDHGFHGDTLINQLVDDIQIQPGYRASALGRDLHQAVFLQALQQAAHRRTRQTETLAQIVFTEPFTRFPNKMQDFIGQQLKLLFAIH